MLRWEMTDDVFHSRPAFMDPASAVQAGYPGGGDEVPHFDAELIDDAPEAPSRGIINRYREVARLHSHGRTNNDICAILGYTATRLSIILKDPFVQAEIEQWRARFIDNDAIAIMRDAAKDGARFLHQKILDPNTKDTVALDASKFVIEKTHGKAKQEVNVEVSLAVSLQQTLKEMKERGEPLDVTPVLIPAAEGGPDSPETAGEPHDAQRWSTWVKQNV